MNEHEIETLLSGLQPSGPSASLTREVGREMQQDRQWMLEPARRGQGWMKPVFWSSLGAAAAVLVMGVMSGTDAGTAPAVSVASAAPAATSILPVRTIREVVGADNEGIHYNADSRLPEQHMKLRSLERHAWIDPRDGAQITVEMPREESVILPVSFQ